MVSSQPKKLVSCLRNAAQVSVLLERVKKVLTDFQGYPRWDQGALATQIYRIFLDQFNDPSYRVDQNYAHRIEILNSMGPKELIESYLRLLVPLCCKGSYKSIPITLNYLINPETLTVKSPGRLRCKCNYNDILYQPVSGERNHQPFVIRTNKSWSAQ